jgi:ribosomal protein L11 methyltransferase
MLYAELDAFEPVGIHEHESGDGWRVFFRVRAQRDAARRTLAAEFENALELHAVDVDDEDWARRSQESLHAIRVGRIVVAPPWDVPDSRHRRQATRDRATAAAGNNRLPTIESASRQPPAASRDAIVVVIDPSTGFGTGHHATTRLCLELLQEVEVQGKRVIDVGTGSGVLAIASWKLGAREVVAIDHDPDALQNARDNMQRNGVQVDLVEADLSAVAVAPAEIVLANLTSAALQRFAGALGALVAPAGVMIVSGFSPDDLDDVARALTGSVAMRLQDGEWAAAMVTMVPLTGRAESRQSRRAQSR